ncbi:dolichyl-P-Man:Man7GlcNAc2-PP-dolichol alpha-1,6-mannosyltransferase [Malassezia yamatoensis]|uniref:Mannosyltransferase n=1 Tax=Malassezia yamatoensis TaxID=253288 RepID=A0AAJ5YTG4_9BASI|nr:dolichyl-P-Man:Man7GlcNAc2-PP-dolichol alpha-1,6-mannosyltransferase [Malassezia yamatoensis]
MHETWGFLGLGGGLIIPIALAPFTKVEESFTLQAVHDLLTYGVRNGLAEYDHIHFPGAVPRSFLGPIVIASLSSPVLWFKRLASETNSVQAQFIVRLALAFASWLALIQFAKSVLRAQAARTFFYWICASQYHLVFWSTRTTPNSVAFPIVVLAAALLFSDTLRQVKAGLAMMIVVACTLRLEVLGIAAPACLYAWRLRHIPLTSILGLGVVSTFFGALLTLSIDTFFWSGVDREQLPSLGQIVWPELNAVQFNVLQGHSAEWGTDPWYSYWFIQLPRLLAPTLPLLLVGLVQRSSIGFPRSALLLMCIFHTSLLSMLAHKEWRFLQYTLPLWNAISAQGAVTLSRSAQRLIYRGWAKLLPWFFVALNLAFAIVSIYASMYNYPGGRALQIFHQKVSDQGHVKVHLDTLATMTGVSRFQSTHLTRPPTSLVSSSMPFWMYDKTENLDTDADWGSFTHLISEYKDCRVPGHSDHPWTRLRDAQDCEGLA